MLLEQRRPDERDVAEQRPVELRPLGQLFLRVADADERREADAEQAEREPRRVLVRVQVDHEDAERGGHQRTGHGARAERDPVVAGVHAGREAGDRGDEHHAFGAEVDDAGALVDQEAQARDREHGAGVQRRGDEECERVHGVSPQACLICGAAGFATGGCARRSGPAHAVVDQRVACEQREQQQTLEHAGQRLRQPEPRLRELAADVEHAHQQRREDDAHRVQPPDEGDDDRGEAVARRHVRRQLPERAGRLETTRKAGHAARQQQRGPQPGARREACVARGHRREPADLQLEAAIRAEQEDPEAGHRDERDHDADVRAQPVDQPRNLRRRQERDRLREVVAARVLPRAVDEVAEHHLGDIDEHQADEDLVRVEAIAQQRDDAGPQHAAEHAGQQDRHDDPAAHVGCGLHRDPAGAQRADDELPFGADVPHVRAEAHRQAERDEDQRRGLHRQLGQRVQALHRLDEEHVQALHRVLAEQREQHDADDHRDRERKQRRCRRHQLRRLRPDFKLQHGSPPSRSPTHPCPTAPTSTRRSSRSSPATSARSGSRGPAR